MSIFARTDQPCRLPRPCPTSKVKEEKKKKFEKRIHRAMERKIYNKIKFKAKLKTSDFIHTYSGCVFTQLSKLN